MARKRTTAYWLILMALILLGTAVMSVGEAQARYTEDTLIFNTVAEPAPAGVTSNVLSAEPVTILLGQMPRTGCIVEFTLESDIDTDAPLMWSVDRPEYLRMSVGVDAVALNTEDPVTLKAGEPETVTMILMPTVDAITMAHEAQDVNIAVAWGDELRGIFRITIPEVTEEEASLYDDTDVPQEEETPENEELPPEEEPEEPMEEILPGNAARIIGMIGLEGRPIREGEFTVNLYPAGEDNTVAEDAEPVAAAVNQIGGAFAFDPLIFETVGTYRYIAMQDTSGSPGGVVCDDNAYLVTVEVLEVEIETDGGTEMMLLTQVSVTDPEGTESELRFENKYVPAEAVYHLNGIKRLTGAILTEEMFSFSLYETDGEFAPQGDAIQTVSNDADGAFTFEALRFGAAGIYNFLISEDIPAEVGKVSYDDSLYRLEVLVEDDEEGQLTAQGQVTRVDGDPVDTITFFNTYNPTAEDAPLVELQTVAGFASSEPMPVWINWVAGVDCIELTMGSGETSRNFPAFTRYTLDSGTETCNYLLYFESAITFETGDAASASLTLDFSQAQSVAAVDQILEAKAYNGQWLAGTVTLNAGPDMGTYYQMESSVLSKDSPLVIALPRNWVNEVAEGEEQPAAEDYILDYSIEMLLPTAGWDPEAGSSAQKIDAQYVSMGEESGLIVEHTATEQAHTLTIRLGETLIPAGTYRVNMNWIYKEICFEQTQITFFINYSAQQKLDTQEVPNNE